jgi:hypothetical protein
MLQAIQIETQAQQKSLALLHQQRGAGRSRREEESFDQSPTPVELLRKRSPHLGAHAVDAPGFLSPLGRNHALRAESLPDVNVILCAVELGVGQYKPDPGLPGSHLDDRRQIRTVVPGPPSRGLSQQELLIHIRHDHPLRPMPRQQWLCP